MSQPAVTTQIKLFEDFCNLRLFRKKGGKIYLTNEGEKVLIDASRIFELERQLEETINGLKNLKQGSLRIGTTKTYAKHFMPIILPPFQKSFPNVIIELDEGSSLAIAASLLDFRNSLAIIAKFEDNPDIIFTPMMFEEVVLIAAPNYHLAKKDEISFGDIQGEPIVIKELGSETRKLVEQHAFSEEVRLNIIAQSSNTEFIKELVKQGEAISFVIRSAVERELAQGELAIIPIKASRLLLQVYLAYLRNYELPFAERTFFNYLQPLIQSKELPIGVESSARKLLNAWVENKANS